MPLIATVMCSANILPPPDDLTLPIVKLLTHPVYRTYQSHTASLSLFANLFVNFLPPAWGAPTPPTPAPESEVAQEKTTWADSTKNEWKRRIKMYSAYLWPLSLVSLCEWLEVPELTSRFWQLAPQWRRSDSSASSSARHQQRR